MTNPMIEELRRAQENERERQKDVAQQQRLKDIELFNEHQQDTRKRVDTLGKSVLLVSGGAFSLSASAILRKESLPIPKELIPDLVKAWGCFAYSMIAIVLLTVAMIFAQYMFGEHWRAVLFHAKKEQMRGQRVMDIIQWAIGVSGVTACITGLGLLAYVAAKMAGA